MAREQDILIGRIAGAFGIKGEVKVVVLTEFPERFAAGNRVMLRLPKGERREVLIERNRPHKGGVTLKLEGVETRDEADALRDTEVIISEDQLGKLPEDQFYIFDIIGLRVFTDDGRDVGEVTEVLHSSANDVYVTSSGILIPAIKDVVTKIDIDSGEMIIHPMPGLLPEE